MTEEKQTAKSTLADELSKTGVFEWRKAVIAALPCPVTPTSVATGFGVSNARCARRNSNVDKKTTALNYCPRCRTLHDPMFCCHLPDDLKRQIEVMHQVINRDDDLLRRLKDV